MNGKGLCLRTDESKVAGEQAISRPAQPTVLVTFSHMFFKPCDPATLFISIRDLDAAGFRNHFKG